MSFIATRPGAAGVAVAFVAEMAISFGLMLVVLFFSNRPRLAPFTGLAAGVLVEAYITFEAPLSGMSMNPARSLASALPAGQWGDLWLNFSAPLLDMLAAAAVVTRSAPRTQVGCAKLQHADDQRCIHCGYQPPSTNSLQRAENAAAI